MSVNKLRITLLRGDGVGPEVSAAVEAVFKAALVPVTWEICEAGAAVFKKGLSTGVPQETIDSILSTKLVLKGPLETPVGYGSKSANVTLRKLFETYGNIRPARLLPGVKTLFSEKPLDLVVIRENVEDLYTGIEYAQSSDVSECLKVITGLGCEKIARLAFEVARAEGRKKVHCATKANIMKLTEGLLKRVFEEVSQDYPEIEAKHIIVDNCAHQLVIAPEQFDVIVTTNLNGDILSDLCSGLVGGLGVAPSANIGNNVAMFEAVHGSAPDIAGKGIVNPTSLLLSSVMLLRHARLFDFADIIENAIFKTFEDGILTADLTKQNPASTTAFTEAVIARLGKRPTHSQKRDHKPLGKVIFSPQKKAAHIEEKGFDLAIRGAFDPATLGESLEKLVKDSSFVLHGISNRGMQVYPLQKTVPDFVDLWHCRFKTKNNAPLEERDLTCFLNEIGKHYVWSQLTKLLHIEGKEAYAKSQGEK